MQLHLETESWANSQILAVTVRCDDIWLEEGFSCGLSSLMDCQNVMNAALVFAKSGSAMLSRCLFPSVWFSMSKFR